MSAAFVAFTLLSLAGLSVLAWLVSKPLAEEAALKLDNHIEDLVPLHTQHFPQLRQALNLADSRYLRQKVTPELHRKWRDERRRILAAFLAGLAEDFAKLDRLGRTIASLSPRLSYKDEFGRIWLNIRFRANFRIVKFWVLAGATGPLSRLSYLTMLLGQLSARTEGAMTRLEMHPS